MQEAKPVAALPFAAGRCTLPRSLAPGTIARVTLLRLVLLCAGAFVAAACHGDSSVRRETDGAVLVPGDGGAESSAPDAAGGQFALGSVD